LRQYHRALLFVQVPGTVRALWCKLIIVAPANRAFLRVGMHLLKQTFKTAVGVACAIGFLGVAGAQNPPKKAASAPSGPNASACYTLKAGNKYNVETSLVPASYKTAGGANRTYPVKKLNLVTVSQQVRGADKLWSVKTEGLRDALFELTDASLELKFVTLFDPKGEQRSELLFQDYKRNRLQKVGQTEEVTFVQAETTLAGNPSRTKFSHVLEAVENLKTPAGVFKGACRFKVLSREVEQASDKPRLTEFVAETVHYAPGYGLVKAVSVLRFTDGRVPDTLTSTYVATQLIK
jgi:hypothetical protein